MTSTKTFFPSADETMLCDFFADIFRRIDGIHDVVPIDISDILTAVNLVDFEYLSDETKINVFIWSASCYNATVYDISDNCISLVSQN